MGQGGQEVQNQGQALPIEAQVTMQAVAAAAVLLPFALGLGQDNNDLNFTTPSCKTYYKAITPLKIKFDGTPQGFIIFMDGIQDCVR